MSAHHRSLSASDRIQISAKVTAPPGLNRSQAAREAGVSRPTLYIIADKGRKALETVFNGQSTPATAPGLESY
ncbi:MAG: hypothetical protein HYV63_02445 [Candidatus Schekmanbacteria bacterium]|nr:hypothetical protein [Candidatus Schekmanbacteria bacterium]